MLGRFSNAQLSKYPHMSAEESIIWTKFLIKFGSLYDRFDYDLRVGAGINADENEADYLKKDWYDLTRRRIDAVGYEDKIATIFEIKQRSSFSAIGQLIGYKQLFNQTYPKIFVQDLILVCGSANPEDYPIFNKQNITIIIP